MNALLTTAVQKALSFKFASHEVIHYEILCNAWRIEEKERAVDFLQEVQSNNKAALSIADDELEMVKRHLGVRGIDITREDLDFYHGFHSEEALAFETISSQVQQVEKYSVGHGIPLNRLHATYPQIDNDISTEQSDVTDNSSEIQDKSPYELDI